MNPANHSRRNILIVVVVLLALMGIIFALTGYHANKSPDNLKAKGYYDPNSHETVSTEPGKGPDTYGVAPGQPVLLGLSDLLNYGVSSYQLDDLKQALVNFSAAHKASEVSVNINTINATPHSQDYPHAIQTVTFKLVVNRKTTYNATLVCQNLTTVELLLHDTQTNSLVFDSASISGAD